MVSVLLLNGLLDAKDTVGLLGDGTLVLMELPLGVLEHQVQPQRTSPQVHHLVWVERLCSPLVEGLCSPLELQDQLESLVHVHEQDSCLIQPATRGKYFTLSRRKRAGKVSII